MYMYVYIYTWMYVWWNSITLMEFCESAINKMEFHHDKEKNSISVM